MVTPARRVAILDEPVAREGSLRRSTVFELDTPTLLQKDRMSDITFVKPHSLPIAKAKALVQKAADGLAAEYDLNNEWHGNTLRFHRLGVDGQVQVTASEIRLDLTLGLLLKPLRGKIIGHIEQNFDNVLTQEPRAKTKRLNRKTERRS